MRLLFKKKSSDLVVGNVPLFFLAASGPLFLFAAFAFLLFRTSWELWPFILLSSSGLFAAALFQRKGFYASFFSLLILAAIEHNVWLQQPWCALFLAATVLSWGIVLLGQEEVGQWIRMEKQKKGDLEQANRELQEAVQQLQAQAEKEPASFDEEFKAALASRNAAVDNQHRAYEEVKKLREQCDALSQEIVWYQRKEKAFQIALEDAQAQVLKYKYAEPLKAHEAVNPVISQESFEEKGEVSLPVEMRQIEHQYAQLKEQFAEKSEALKLARQELFRLEGELTLLRKEDEEKRSASCSEEMAYQTQLQALIAQCQDLEGQVQSLEGIISALVIKKKATTRGKPRKKGKTKPLPELLQKAIDHNHNQYSLLD